MREPNPERSDPVTGKARSSRPAGIAVHKRMSPKAKPKPHNGGQPSPLFYALVALIAFGLGLGVLSLMLWNAKLLVEWGLTGNFYYVLLLALGLSAAAFLFGLLQSHAVYQGKTGWGNLELGGAVVGCALVVVGGFYFVHDPLPFAISVFVHGQEGIHDLVPENTGQVLMELGTEVRPENIGPKGTAYFTNIPPTFRGKEVPVWVESKQYEAAKPDQRQRLVGDSIQLEVRKRPGRIYGWVQDQNGRALAGVSLEAVGISVRSDSNGHFELLIPGNQLQPALDLVARATGYGIKHFTAVPNASELDIQLAPEK